MAFQQSTRQADLITPLGPDVLLFYRMVANEGVSQLFHYDMTVLCEDENLNLEDLIGQHAHVELELPHGATRYFAGHVTRFSFTGYRGELAQYRVELRPWFWFLTRAVNNRIFQNKTVPEIIQEVCAEHGFTDIDDRLTAAYKPREFCVQYRETDFDFLSRLMEDEGIYYYFSHEAGKHELVLADSVSAHETFGDYGTVPYYPPDSHDHRERDYLDHWLMTKSVRSGKYALRDYNFEKPKTFMEVKSQIIREIENAEYEVYDYPGDYMETDDGDTIVRKRMEEAQADFETLRGSGDARGMIPGFLFELENYPRDDQNREYLILTVSHDITSNTFDPETDRDRNRFIYQCSLRAMPSSEVFRPPRSTPKPIVHGPQTAVVVGESGEEIWTDKYGRVKVEFHWDRRDNDNETSSCWVRVSQGWAGKKWGMQFLPRMGQEVIVEFLEGDPDQPIVTGSVYNADNMPPYELPANATQSGIKTRSSKDGSSANFNEIRFEDKKGSEHLYMHAEKDRQTEVENNDTLNIGSNRDQTVGGNETIHIKKNRTDTVDINVSESIGKDRDTTIAGDDELDVKGNRDTSVGKNNKLKVTGSHTTEIIGGWTHRSQKIGVLSLSNIDVTAAANYSLKAAGKIDIMAAGLITIMSPPGVKIVHNDHQDIGLMRKEIETMHERISALEKNVKGTSESHVGVSLSQVGVEFANKGISTAIVQLNDTITNLNLGFTNIDLTTGMLDIKNKTFHSIG
jgi:type VI secretion system secreted protein VgrG